MLLPGFVLGAAALVAVHFALLNTFWDYSEGVYALSAHMVLHGAALYSGIAGAQPPGVFLTGVALLAFHDSLEWLRFGGAFLQLGAGLIAGQIVLRITGNRLASILTPAAVLLTPWAVREHGALIPEVTVLPVLLGAALLSRSERHAPLAGFLCGLLPMFKFPFVIPAVVLIALSADVRRNSRWALGTLALALATTTAVAGESFWRDVLLAQLQSGQRSLGILKGVWAQGGWNVFGLAVTGTLAIVYRHLSRDPAMLRTALGLAAAMIVTFLTNVKVGTSLNITVPVEATLVPLAASGVVFALRAARAWWLPLACVCALLFTLAQSVSLIVAPQHPEPFLRAFSRPAWAVLMTRPEFRASVAEARRCPPGVPYSGQPLLAFAADRPMPGGQPDQFIITHARTLAALRARVDAVKHLCP